MTNLIILLLCFLSFGGLKTQFTDYKNQILQLKDGINDIKKYIADVGKKQTFDRLAMLGDNFGPRAAGSQSLESAIDYIVNIMNNTDQFDDVHTEDVQIHKWVRGKQTAKIILPKWTHEMNVMSLGTSVSTNGPLRSSFVVVRSFDELDQIKDQVNGKIVVFNQEWVNYGKTVKYRTDGASRASMYGAVATLIRSVTDLSIDSPHTGSQTYQGNVTKIPTVCITVEDAELLQRLYNRKEHVSISIEIDIKTEMPNDTISRNIVAELKGSTNPEQVIIFGGHIDSWDVGTGSMDDGGGCLIAWQALKILKTLNLKTKRTIRIVLWTAEEIGLVGGQEYYNRHRNDSENVSLIMESDHGVFKPRGIQFTGTKAAQDILQFTLDTYLKEYNMTELAADGASSDTSWWVKNDKVPGIELYSHNGKYFNFHHSQGDTMTVMNAENLDYATLLWTTIVYVVGNLKEILPRDEPSINSASINDVPLPFHVFKIIRDLFKWSTKF